MNKILLFLIALLLVGCSNTKPFIRTDVPSFTTDRPQNHASVVTFYALGDWGTGSQTQHAVANVLVEDVRSIAPGRKIKPFVIGLGDNFYTHGLPEGWNNPETNLLLEQRFGAVYDSVLYRGAPVDFHIVPGNHDYGKSLYGKKGWGDVIQQETLAESKYPNWNYYPISVDRNEIPDSNDETEYAALHAKNIFDITLPERVPLDSEVSLTMIALDTQILLELYKRSEHSMLHQRRLRQHLKQLRTLLSESGDNWNIVIGHHPVRTHGRHGGFIAFKDWLWRPFPVISVPYNLFNLLFAKSIQDTDHKHYKAFRKDLREILNEYKAYYLSGHAHSLQFLRMEESYQVVSGSAAQKTPVTHKDDSYFAHEAPGFVRFDVTRTELWIRFHCVVGRNCERTPSATFRFAK